MSSLEEMKKLGWMKNMDWGNLRDRPAVITVNVASIDDTSYFDNFPDVNIDISRQALKIKNHNLNLKSIFRAKSSGTIHDLLEYRQIRDGLWLKLDVSQLHIQKVRRIHSKRTTEEEISP